ncbi:uncharacterized protein (DUF983 family) [Roseibium hamelinense]|uniref:Uncharacterized protein (DUF983 family) n=1 Tax=Roseibium hamelinense TaxID=150831 RepID=A0A562T3T7_9HYPH|nr:DUF983 domain-containing protein [Roseibium hamelinense]MTI42944.1 DUF983 domain-containing protein [Roseibium hamelinense]TWI87620.1 uncharacterized protein (DUF983 family) [Roseibium hamelinense]
MTGKADFPKANPVKAGLSGACPSCGQGKLFNGFLSLKPACAVCGQRFDFADSGDGPAVFVIMIVGFIVVGLVLAVELTYQPPIWVHMVLWLPLTVVLAAGALRPLKGLMIALQFQNNAKEGELDD